MRLNYPNRALYLLAAGGIFFVVMTFSWQRVGRSLRQTIYSGQENMNPPCRLLAGADDILMIMKTGATELQDKLTVHLHTTLTCYSQYLIFSDYEEVLPGGEHVLDALKYVSPSIQESHPDFDLWRRLQREGRAGLLPSQLSGSDSREKDESIRVKYPGWKLDKWKFLPMLNQTLHLHPDKRWYVFVEADTYLFWPSLLTQLDLYSWTDSHYIGARTGIGDDNFAHGGSGFAISRPALESVVGMFTESQQEWEDFTDAYWAGDHILGVAMQKAGVLLLRSAPMWRGDPVGHLVVGDGGTTWCQTAITSHHESPQDIEALWRFEQDWIVDSQKPADADSTPSHDPKALRWKDVWERYVFSQLSHPRSSWDNLASTVQDAVVSTLSECEAICQSDPGCVQYSLHYGELCSTATQSFLGEAAEGVESGWIPERIQRLSKGMHRC